MTGSLSFAVFLLLVCVAIVTAPVLVPFAKLKDRAERRRFQRRERSLADQGRLLTWADVVPNLRAGKGSLILRGGAVGRPGMVVYRTGPAVIEDGWELWWIAARPQHLRPTPIFAPDEGIHLVTSPHAEQFADRYLTADGDGASLVRTVETEPGGEFLWQYFKRRFPHAAVVVLG